MLRSWSRLFGWSRSRTFLILTFNKAVEANENKKIRSQESEPRKNSKIPEPEPTKKGPAPQQSSMNSENIL